jgi:tRNA A37 N6-isopentenylltransferase MiaA
MNLRDRLVESIRRRYLEVEIDGLGTVRLQSLSEGDYSRVEDAKPEDRRPLLVARTLVDSAGDRLFADEDVDTISEMDFAVVHAIAERAMLHCRTQTTVENAVKN